MPVDLVVKQKSRSYLNLVWRCSFSRSVLSPGVQEISTGALDVDQGETYRLGGSFELAP